MRHRRARLSQGHGGWLSTGGGRLCRRDRKSTRLNSSHDQISYAVFCLKKKSCPTHASFSSSPHARNAGSPRRPVLFGSPTAAGCLSTSPPPPPTTAATPTAACASCILQ